MSGRALNAAMVAVLCVFSWSWAEDQVRALRDTDVKLGADVIGSVKAGTIVSKVKQQGDWVGIRYNEAGKTVSGWVPRAAVEDVTPAAATVAPTPAGPAGQASEGGVARLEKAQGAIASLRFRSVNDLVGKLQALVMQIQPAFAGVISPDALLSQLPPEVQETARKVLDFNRPFGGVVYPGAGGEAVEGKGPEPDLCFLIPVKDLAAAAAFVQQMSAPNVSVQLSGEYLLASNRPAVLERAAADFGAIRSIAMDDLKSDVQLAFYMDNLYQAVEPQLENQLREAIRKAEMAQGLEERKAAGSDKFGVELGKFLLKEFSQARVDLGIEAQGLRLLLSGDARPGSVTANFLKNVANNLPGDLTGTVPTDNAVFLQSLRMSGPEIAKFGRTVLTTVVAHAKATGEIPPEEEAWAAKVQDRLGALLDCCQGNLAVTLFPMKPGPVGVVMAFGTRGDSMRAAFNAFIAEIEEHEKNAGRPAKATLKTGAREYQQVAIDSIIPLDPEKADDLQAEVVHLPGVSLLALGKPVDAVTNAAIERVKARAADVDPKIQKAAKNFKTSPMLLATIYVMKIIAAAEQADNAGEPDEELANLAAADEPVLAAASVDGHRVVSEIYVPVQPMRLIQAYIMKKMMAGAAAQPGQGGEQPGQPQF
ncbi:MAG: hypothetical protein HYU36_19640 [Planctomycetes bacterium]|nr:hypothetical protein [Planctomycetota bacterium]